MIECPRIRLHNGVEIPQFGLGVFRSEPGDETVNAVSYALESGYRHIDTAAMYKNEVDVAKGLKKSGVARGDVFITTKLSTDATEAGDAEGGIRRSLEALETDYIDLYLIHWPTQGYLAAWETICAYYEKKVIRAIGVSNFQERHIEAIEAAGLIKPMVNQIELHPRFQQRALKEYCEARDIAIEAWSPIGGRDHLCINDPIILEIAKKHGKTGAQIALRWHIEMRNIIFPKSAHNARIRENADIFGFALDAADHAAIAAMDGGQRLYWDPDRFGT